VWQRFGTASSELQLIRLEGNKRKCLKKKNSCDTRAVSGYFSEEGADERMKLVR
jgi:hypothetical protein